jgi:hypothetical protein
MLSIWCIYGVINMETVVYTVLSIWLTVVYMVYLYSSLHDRSNRTNIFVV